MIDGIALGPARVALLHPEDQIVREMLDGWRNQQLSRALSFQTIGQREQIVTRFLAFTNKHPWNWTPGHVDEFFGDLRSAHGVKQTTLRNYQNALGLFCGYISDPGYGWNKVCLELFGTHPTQVCFEWNTATHVQEAEAAPGKRAFTKTELQAFFDRADDETIRIARHNRKGWLPAFRDSVVFKIAYAYGLRRNEARHLETVDFSRNPLAREFGSKGVLNIRYGKAMKGSAPKRRSVLTVFDWTPEILDEWEERGRTRMTGGLELFPSERGTLVAEAALSTRFRRYRDELDLSPGLDFHSLRRSYVTHLIEDGYDALFVQRQVGHEYASTTGLYTSVSSDYRTRTLRRVLDQTIHEALARKTPTMTTRTVDYQWHLAELMARNAMHNTTDLASHLTERGITLSASQIYRLVTNRPERISLPILSALCDIFGCTPTELITVTAETKKTTKRTVNSDVIDLKTQARPRRARVIRDDD